MLLILLLWIRKKKARARYIIIYHCNTYMHNIHIIIIGILITIKYTMWVHCSVFHRVLYLPRTKRIKSKTKTITKIHAYT